MILLKPPALPKGQYFGWENKLCAQPRAGQAWQRVAVLFFFGCSRGAGLSGRSLPFFSHFVAFVSYVVVVCKLILQK